MREVESGIMWEKTEDDEPRESETKWLEFFWFHRSQEAQNDVRERETSQRL